LEINLKKTLLITLVIIFPALSACTNINKSQASKDTLACSNLSYNNPQANLKAVDAIFNQCMDDKKKIRDKKQSDNNKLAFFSFLIDTFLPSKD